MNMNYSESSLFDYGDHEVEENAGNAGVDHVIEIVSKVARRLSQDSNKSRAADRRDDNKQARTMETEAAVPDTRSGVNDDAVMVVTERTSTSDDTVIACSRSTRADATENSEVHLSEPAEPAMYVGSSSATPMDATRSQSAELQQHELEQAQQQQVTQPDIKELEKEEEEVEEEMPALDP